MNLDFTAISTAAAVLGVLVALYAIWVENRRSRFSQGIDLVMRMSDTFFYSKDFISTRRKAAEFLNKKSTKSKNSKTTSKNDKRDPSTSGELETILDFFEGVALLVRRGALDLELVSNYFYWWFVCYYTLSYDYIIHVQQDDPSYWCEIVWLRRKLSRFERKKNSKHGHQPSTDELRAFINDELTLK